MHQQTENNNIFKETNKMMTYLWLLQKVDKLNILTKQ